MKQYPLAGTLSLNGNKIWTYDQKWLTRIQLLRKVQKHVLRAPLTYNQNVTVEGEGAQCPSFRSVVIPKNCKTVACIGGWCSLLVLGPGREDLQRMAAFLGDSTKPTWIWLFNADFQGTVLFDRYMRSRGPAGGAKVASRAIEAYIKEIKCRKKL